MIFTQEDRNLLKNLSVDMDKLIVALSQKGIKFSAIITSVETNNEETVSVSGGLDLSGAAEAEEDILREQVNAKLKKVKDGPFFAEDALDAEELEAMQN